MFALVKGFLDWYFEVPAFKILLIGDESSGKTVLNSIKPYYNLFY